MADTQQRQAKVWGGFKPGQRIEPNIPAGLHPAKLATIEEVDTEYGTRLRLVYEVQFDGETRRVSELCSPTYSPGSKFIKRLGAVNDMTITEDDDLDTLDTSGPVVVKLSIDDKGYNKVDDVMSPAAMKPARGRRATAPAEEPADELPF